LPISFAAALLLLGSPVAAEEVSFEVGSSRAQQDLEQSLAELAALRRAIADEKLPMTRRLGELENRLLDLRSEYDEVVRQFDSSTLDLSNMGTTVKARQEEKTYLSNLLEEYARNFEARLHIAELQRYRDELDRARIARENPELTPAEVFSAEAELIDASVDRALGLLGGETFEGKAVASDGSVRDVRFALLGPLALYSTEDGSDAGIAEQRLGSLEPNMIAMERPEWLSDVRTIVASGAGRLPFDPTLGSARKVEQSNDTLVEHASKGGPVMVPILLLAAAALVVGILKWLQLARVRMPSTKKVGRLLEVLKRRDFAAARQLAEKMPRPTGPMLEVGVEHVGEPKELVEEVMYEKVLETRLELQRFLSFVAVSAAAAPLLGLLGTVTGIINTFKMITVFGTGDAKTLSSGISEALITTEFGLIVAIPSLFLHAYLSRRVRRIIDRMEKTAVSFINRVLIGNSAAATMAAEPTPEGVGGLAGAEPALARGVAMVSAVAAEARDH
jgi:biopolymer transport protein ExbB